MVYLAQYADLLPYQSMFVRTTHDVESDYRQLIKVWHLRVRSLPSIMAKRCRTAAEVLPKVVRRRIKAVGLPAFNPECAFRPNSNTHV